MSIPGNIALLTVCEAASRHAHASFQEIEFNYEANEGTTPKENIAFANTFNVIQYPWYDGHDP